MGGGHLDEEQPFPGFEPNRFFVDTKNAKTGDLFKNRSRRFGRFG